MTKYVIIVLDGRYTSENIALIQHSSIVSFLKTSTFWFAFDSGAIATFFHDLGLWRPGFEHPTFRLLYERSNPQRHRLGYHICHFLKIVRLLSNDVQFFC